LGGTKENETEGFGTLGIALLAAIILVYLVMVSLYDSFTTVCGIVCYSAFVYWSIISLGFDQ
jgi:multidrug efflux pump subunit AcrB